MIFTSNGSELVNVEETGAEVKYTWGLDRGPHLEMCASLREHDEQNGMSTDRHFQHVASMDEITYGILLTTQPEVLQDSKELHKWLQTDVGRECRVSRDARPIKGDGLQVIIK